MGFSTADSRAPSPTQPATNPSTPRFHPLRPDILAYPLPATIIAELLGVRMADLDQFKQWSDDIAGSFTFAPSTMRQAHAALEQLTAYVAELIAEHRHRPAETLLDQLLLNEAHGD